MLVGLAGDAGPVGPRCGAVSPVGQSARGPSLVDVAVGLLPLSEGVSSEAQSVEAQFSATSGGASSYNWRWVPAGTLDRQLGFPASFSDLRRHLPRLFSGRSSSSAMDRDRLEREHRLKRPAADLERGNDRARERDLRPHLDREQERRMQRDREAAAARQREQDRREEEIGRAHV